VTGIPTTEILPPAVIKAFQGAPSLALPDLAPAMGYSVKTLRKHRELGNLPVHIKGTGVARRHYVCTLADVAEFYRRTGESCQSSRSEIPRTINSTSKSKVLDFPGPRNAGMNVTRRKSRGRAVPRPNASLTPTPRPDAGQ